MYSNRVFAIKCKPKMMEFLEENASVSAGTSARSPSHRAGGNREMNETLTHMNKFIDCSYKRIFFAKIFLVFQNIIIRKIIVFRFI